MSFAGPQKITHPDTREPDGQHTYTCAHCNVMTSGLVAARYSHGHTVIWLICTSCGHGSVYNNGILYPSSKFGPAIDGLQEEVLKAYEEARICFSVNAFTASELICRKILMHVAVDKGAKENEEPVEKGNFCTGKKNQIQACYRSNSSRGPHRWRLLHVHVAQAGEKRSSQIKGQIACVAQSIVDIVAKNVQKKHVEG